LGSRENPIEVGGFAVVGDWRVRVVDVNPNANQVVASENQFNDPPAAGEVFVLIGLEVTFAGTESGDVWADLRFKSVGPSNVAFEDGCGVIPEALIDQGEVFPGGTVAANVCFSVSEGDAQDLQLIVEESFSLDETRNFMSLSVA